jgi:hypothetical protein
MLDRTPMSAEASLRVYPIHDYSETRCEDVGRQMQWHGWCSFLTETLQSLSRPRACPSSLPSYPLLRLQPFESSSFWRANDGSFGVDSFAGSSLEQEGTYSPLFRVVFVMSKSRHPQAEASWHQQCPRLRACSA